MEAPFPSLLVCNVCAAHGALIPGIAILIPLQAGPHVYKQPLKTFLGNVRALTKVFNCTKIVNGIEHTGEIT